MTANQGKALLFFRQAMPLVVACALTWSIGSLTNFMLPRDDGPHSSRRVPSIYERRTELANLPAPREKSDLYRQVHFIDKSQLSIMDMVSGSWIQPLSTFLEMNVQGIKSVDDGCLQAIKPNLDQVRMTLDWLDFSVEHMSEVS